MAPYRGNSDNWIRQLVKFVVSQFHFILKSTLPWFQQTNEFPTQQIYQIELVLFFYLAICCVIITVTVSDLHGKNKTSSQASHLRWSHHIRRIRRSREFIYLANSSVRRICLSGEFSYVAKKCDNLAILFYFSGEGVWDFWSQKI